MLSKYNEFNMREFLNEAKNFILPNPVGIENIYEVGVYSDIFKKKNNELLADVKKKLSKFVIDFLNDKIKNRLISLPNTKGKRKIIFVKNITTDDYGQIFFEDETSKIQYDFNSDNSEIFFVDKFFDFFDKNYKGKLTYFYAKPTTGIGTEQKYLQTITAMGVKVNRSSDLKEDNIIIRVENNDTYFLSYMTPLVLVDSEVKKYDPHGEEDWSN